MSKDALFDTDVLNQNNTVVKVDANTSKDRNSGKVEISQDKRLKSDRGSIFNSFFQSFSGKIWDSFPENASIKKVDERMQGEVYCKSWCFRVTQNQKLDWLYIVFKGQY